MEEAQELPADAHEPVPPTMRQLTRHYLELVKENHPTITAIDLSYGKVYQKPDPETGDYTSNPEFLKSLWDEEGSGESLPAHPYRRLQDLFEALARNNKVKSVDLSWNYIKDAGAAYIGEFLAKNRTHSIQTVKLWGCGIGPHGAQQLAQALVYRNSLKIELWGNGIGPEGQKAMNDAKRTRDPQFMPEPLSVPPSFEIVQDSEVPRPCGYAVDKAPNHAEFNGAPGQEQGYKWGGKIYDKKTRPDPGMGDVQQWFQNTTTNAQVKGLLKKKKK